MNYSVKIIVCTLILSQASLFCMHKPVQSEAHDIARKILWNIGPITAEKKLGFAIGATYIVSTYLMLPAALYYCEKNAFLPTVLFSRKNYIKR